MADTVIGRLLSNSKGNLSVIFALVAVPLVFSIGMGIDYTAAGFRKDQLNAVADAAVLAALRPSVMAQADSASVAAATNAFNAQATTISGINYDPAGLKVAVSDSSTAVSVKRTVTVSYTAASQNSFLGILGRKNIAVAGSSQATASAAPNIDFYLLLDDSPSMAIAATPNDINTMVKNTSSQGGCAFACHESNPAADNLGNPGGIDNYALAKKLGVTLRVDLLRQATQNLMTTAQQVASTDNAQYQMAIYTFDYGFNSVQTLTSSLSLAQSAAGNIDVLKVYKNNWLTASNNNGDTDTNFVNAMNNIKAVMPNPGNGTNASGDTPQEVLFFVTDGVQDARIGGARVQSLIDPTLCTTIKDRGIRIAVLYTTYYPLPTNAWYNKYISPFQPNIGPTLQNCASTGLYFEVNVGGDISAALTTLFQKAVSTAYLSK